MRPTYRNGRTLSTVATGLPATSATQAMTAAAHSAATKKPPRNTHREFSGTKAHSAPVPRTPRMPTPPSARRARREHAGPHSTPPMARAAPTQMAWARRVTAVVAAGGVGPRLRQHRHPGRRDQRAGHGHDEQRPQPAPLARRPGVAGGPRPAPCPGPAKGEYAQDHDRPHQVELLLDGQRPRVHQGRGSARGHEVVGVIGDEVPVGHLEDRGQRVAAQRRAAERSPPRAAPTPTAVSIKKSAGRSRRARRDQNRAGRSCRRGATPRPAAT